MIKTSKWKFPGNRSACGPQKLHIQFSQLVRVSFSTPVWMSGKLLPGKDMLVSQKPCFQPKNPGVLVPGSTFQQQQKVSQPVLCVCKVVIKQVEIRQMNPMTWFSQVIIEPDHKTKQSGLFVGLSVVCFLLYLHDDVSKHNEQKLVCKHRFLINLMLAEIECGKYSTNQKCA